MSNLLMALSEYIVFIKLTNILATEVTFENRNIRSQKETFSIIPKLKFSSAKPKMKDVLRKFH